METQQESPCSCLISPKRAINAGTLRIGFPMFAAIFGGLGIEFVIGSLVTDVHKPMDIRDPVNLGIIIAMFAVPFALGWAWWAYSAPRWRLWAMERVEDWDELSALALKSMLIWPDQPLTRLAAKSEFVTAEILRKKLELEQKRGRTFPWVAG